MNPIENIWQPLKSRIQKRNPRPVAVPELKEAIFEEWDHLTPTDIGKLTESMPERIQDLLVVEGGHTKW